MRELVSTFDQACRYWRSPDRTGSRVVVAYPHQRIGQCHLCAFEQWSFVGRLSSFVGLYYATPDLIFFD